MRRTTIRTLFDELRKNVPAIEGHEATSDRQILMEAASHISELELEDKQCEAEIIALKIENLRLRIRHEEDEAALLEQHGLAAVAKAAEIDALNAEIAQLQIDQHELLQHPVLQRSFMLNREPYESDDEDDDRLDDDGEEDGEEDRSSENVDGSSDPNSTEEPSRTSYETKRMSDLAFSRFYSCN